MSVPIGTIDGLTAAQRETLVKSLTSAQQADYRAGGSTDEALAATATQDQVDAAKR